MTEIGRFLLFSSFVLQVIASQCPTGSIQVPNEDVCIYDVDEARIYRVACDMCAQLGGMAAKVQNAYENTLLLSLIAQAFNYTAPFIGVQKMGNDSWTYADGTPLTYQNWAKNQPNMTSNSTICAIIDPITGKWLASECRVARPYFCSVNVSTTTTTTTPNTRCPSGWNYYENTDACYYLQNYTFTDNSQNMYGSYDVYNATQAEAACQAMNAHLVSIHSKDEENFVYDLIATNIWDANWSCGFGEWTWMGLYGNGSIGGGNWTDGSLVDFVDRKYELVNNYYWVMCNDRSCNCRRWAILLENPGMRYSRFVCKKSARKGNK